MESFFSGLALGYGASVPIGPVNVLIMAYALRGFKFGFATGLGAMSTDVFYLLLMSFGVLAFFNHGFFIYILGTFGAAFLLYIAWLTWKSADKLAVQVGDNSNLDDSNLEGKRETTIFGCYIKGLFLNLVNPYVIGFWLSVASFTAQTSSAALSVAGLIVAIFTWIFGLAFAVAKSRRFISGWVAKWFAWISAALMAFFAFLIIYNTFFKGGV